MHWEFAFNILTANIENDDSSKKEFIQINWKRPNTGPDDAVTKSSANGLVDTGIASRYRLQPRAGFLRPNG